MTAVAPQRRRIAETCLVVALVVLGALITWLRVPADHRDRVWAEDSNIFLGEALDHGGWPVLFHGYAGYQHLVPRLVIAVIEPVLDLSRYAVLVFAICALITGLVGAAVFWLSRDIVPWLPARLTLGLSTFLIPLATQETIGNLADLHTYAMWLAPWLLLYRPRTWWTSVGWAVVTLLTVMTEIQAVFFVFLLVFRLRPRDRMSWPIGGAFLAGAAVQIATAVLGDRKTSNGPLSIDSTVIGWMVNTVMPVVDADPATVRSWVLASGMTAAVLILIPIVAASVLCLVWGTVDQRVLTAALLLGSAAIYTGSAWANSDTWFMYAEEGLENIDVLVVNIRYGVAAGLMLVAVVPLAAAIFVSRFRGRATTAVGLTVCLALTAVLAVGCTTAQSSRGWVDRWSPAVRSAAEICRADDPPERYTLPVAPDRSVDYRCSDVTRLTGD